MRGRSVSTPGFELRRRATAQRRSRLWIRRPPRRRPRAARGGNDRRQTARPARRPRSHAARRRTRSRAARAPPPAPTTTQHDRSTLARTAARAARARPAATYFYRRAAFYGGDVDSRARRFSAEPPRTATELGIKTRSHAAAAAFGAQALSLAARASLAQTMLRRRRQRLREFWSGGHRNLPPRRHVSRARRTDSYSVRPTASLLRAKSGPARLSLRAPAAMRARRGVDVAHGAPACAAGLTPHHGPSAAAHRGSRRAGVRRGRRVDDAELASLACARVRTTHCMIAMPSPGPEPRTRSTPRRSRIVVDAVVLRRARGGTTRAAARARRPRRAWRLCATGLVAARAGAIVGSRRRLVPRVVPRHGPRARRRAYAAARADVGAAVRVSGFGGDTRRSSSLWNGDDNGGAAPIVVRNLSLFRAKPNPNAGRSLLRPLPPEEAAGNRRDAEPAEGERPRPRGRSGRGAVRRGRGRRGRCRARPACCGSTASRSGHLHVPYGPPVDRGSACRTLRIRGKSL